MTQIKATIVADSINEFGNRLTTLLVTLPRIILAELNTHRMLSRNSASSRAIPFEKMLDTVKKNPFIPIAWQKDHKGMQGTEYWVTNDDIKHFEEKWLEARDKAVTTAAYLSLNNVTKQLCNRLLEPFMYHTVLISATEWENFFALRCPQYFYEPEDKTYRSKRDWCRSWGGDFDEKIDWDTSRDYIWWSELNKGQAEIHMMATAEAIWDAINDSTPKQLKAGEWHIPFGDDLDYKEIMDIVTNNGTIDYLRDPWEERLEIAIKISVARCARTSYTTIDSPDSPNTQAQYRKDIELCDRLATSGHWSPFEHVAQAMDEDDMDSYMAVEDNLCRVGVSGNFIGFMQYRKMFDNENITK